MSQINIAEGTATTLTCNFCGSQTSDINRCTGCGATSLTRLDDPLTPEQQTLVHQGVKAQQHMNTIAVVLALGLLIVTWSICSPILLGTKSKPQDLSQQDLAQQHPVQKQQPQMVLASNVLLHMKPIEVAEMPRPELSVHSLFKSKPIEYRKANTTWGDTFNPSKTVPENGFAAYYFNTAAPGRLVHQENVDSPSILYADDFHGISPADFGAYWVGNVEVEQTQLVEVAVKQNKSRARIIINGAIVYEKSRSNDNNKTVVRLEKGTHLVEMEYMSKWHTSVDFSAELKPFSGKLSRSNIKKILANNIPDEYDFHYVGIYKSTNTDQSVKLNIQKTNRKIVLVLSSFRPVNWYLSNPHDTDIAAIVYGSAQHESTVLGDIDSSIIQLRTSRIGRYTSPPGCACAPSGPICMPSRDFIDTKHTVENLGYGRITGMSNRESTSAIKVPQRHMTPGMFEVELQHHAQAQERAAKQCRQKNPGFEDLFSKM